ncbi:MAG: SAM-dependent methyltransferase, MidA [uncultured Nocardioidaceae bacterium]|uniref:SAM-dependent methyltransferase, MidA n=1 Tax=uncultured Nocardioidaceae bacterium TaxID=253824 RepID=A0A6J4MB56_9ACTN|nr:MAG: SAM-dependent methyltransferase, MidA [uncultured Nocardioidaceae bacterium]
MPPPTTMPAWKSAWDAALYGPGGFFRTQSPAAHFRTSVHASPLFAAALVGLVRRTGLETVVDIGAGRGELLCQIQALEPSLNLLGVEVAPRPDGLDPAVGWTSALPESVDGLVVANEWLDNVPCHVVEVDPSGTVRVVHVDPATGEESLGAALDDRSVPRSLSAWCEAWWPMDRAEPGTRAEVGTSRDVAWADVVRRVGRGVAVAVDYGHTRASRPPFGTLRCYRDGREVDVVPDGSRDVTAHVAVDSVASRAGGEVLRQREALHRLGVSAQRPDLALATRDPHGYVAELSLATQAGELVAERGLGDFSWMVSAHPSLRDRIWT